MIRHSALLLLALLGFACAREDAGGLSRRPLAPAAASGWARVALDGAAQRQLDGAWIGDAAGGSVPFLTAQEGLWDTRTLPVTRLQAGRDGEDRPVAAFTLAVPEGWQVGDRESLQVELDLEGAAPWVAQVRAEREVDGGGFLALDPPRPLHLYDLGPSGQRRTLDLPWDSTRYRLTLLATQGTAPRIRSVAVRARTRPEALEAEALLDGTLAPEPGQPRTWRLSLPDAERLVGLELVLAPPAAPLAPELRLDEGGSREAWTATGLVWNLPALHSSASRIAFAPVLARSLLFTLPEGAIPQRAQLLVRRQTLLFPAEAGQTYALHLGGRRKPAPGSLGALPSTRALAASAPLALGPAEPDAQGLPLVATADQRARPWMPWLAGLAVAGLGFAAWRLLRQAG